MALSKQRQEVVKQAHWVLDHGSGWHYEEIRPVPLANIKAGRLPVNTDCSGSCIGIYYRAGIARDPSGYGYSGYGNTDSLSHACEHLGSYSSCEPGDMVVVTNRADHGTVHVYLVLERQGSDLKVFSHGGPGAPKTEMLSAVHSYWYGKGYVFIGLRSLPMQDKLKWRWHVMNGRGDVIGRTNHPYIWHATHKKFFKQYDQIRFDNQTK